MDIFTEIKKAVDIKTAAEYYGIKIKHNKALCPFHAENTPSLSFKNGYYHCFGCGVGGDVIDFVARINGTGQKEAALIINDIFNLGFTSVHPQTSTQQKKDVLLTKYKGWERNTIVELTELFRRYREYMQNEPPFSDKWGEAAERLPVIEYKLDLLQSDDVKTKTEWFKESLEKAGVNNEHR